ncbi:MAG: hypothetical protein HPY76_09615, partial [Anaerolineae bacterium]|nr:hypothetical protein [Anaerolineae bacterium]
MKHHNHKPVFFAVLLALGLALVFTGAVFAEDAPPPEQPAAPAPAAPALPEGSGEVGGEGNTPAPAVGDESTAPLAIMSGDLEILSGQAWYWLGATKTPFANAQAALDNILATGVLPSDRKLYLEDGKFAGFTLDGTAGSGILSQMNGVLGFDGNFTGYNNENASEVAGDGGIEIHHTVTGFTLQGLNISGGDVLFHHNAGTLTLKYIDVSGDGNRLEVTSHNGAINADTVSVNNGEGALLQNTGGVSANITVFNSVFNNNSNGSSDASGLVVHSTGLARLSGIEANGNQGDGLYVTGVTGIEVLNSNTANNGGNGVYALANTAAKVTVNTLQTHYNGDDGIHIETLGDISLLSIAASNNGQNNDGTGGSGFGIAVGTCPTTPGGRNLVGKDLAAWENHDTGIDLKVSGTTSLSGIFTSNNWGTGTWVASSGAITLNGVTSNNDRAAGIHLVNINAATPQPVKILNTYGTNEVSNAQGDYFGTGGLHGVIINTNGSVTINDLSAHDNAFGGIYIEVSNPAGTVTMTNSGAGNNQDFGVQVVAQNSITYKIGWAHNNAGIGMLLNNSGAPTPKPVTLETAGWFYNNQGEAGVKVVSKGIVTLKGINAGDNRGYGILVNNSSGSGSGVSVLGTSTSWLNIARNGEAGLYITSSGAVTLAYISAQENGRSDDPALDKMGIRVTNESPLTPKPVTLSNIDASRNNGSGVEVTAGGTITATNISASDNQLKGVLLRNTTSGGVKVLRTAYWHNDFSRNGEEGLRVEAHGPVTLARLNVYENGWQGQFDGTYIDNCLAGIDEACLGKWAVTLNITSGWNNDFSRNWGMGLYIASGGAVKLSNINISQNGTYGLLVDTNWLNANGAVTIASVGDNQNNFWNNGLDGAGIFATGAITITNFQANDNGRHGLNLSNIGNWLPVFTPVPITLTNGQANNNHNGHGIRARSVGNIKLVDVEASNNDVHYTSIGFDTTVPEKLNDWLWDWDAGAWNEGDVYEFEVTDGPLPVELHVYLEFQGNLVWEMYNSGTDTWDALYSCTDVSECTLTDGNTPNGLYRARITGINQDNRGNYLISLNDSDTDYTSYNYIGASGLWLNNDYYRATGTVTVVNGPIRG